MRRYFIDKEREQQQIFVSFRLDWNKINGRFYDALVNFFSPHHFKVLNFLFRCLNIFLFSFFFIGYQSKEDHFSHHALWILIWPLCYWSHHQNLGAEFSFRRKTMSLVSKFASSDLELMSLITVASHHSKMINWVAI